MVEDKFDTDAKLDHLGFFQHGFNVLDIGSGIGYIPKFIAANKLDVCYHGLDVNMGNVQYCRNILPYSNIKFSYIDIHSDFYNPEGKIAPEKFCLKMADKSVDAVICHSLFTHLDTEVVATRYMQEIKRVLKSGGFLWTTWFASPPNNESVNTRRTVYPLPFIHELLFDFEPIYLNGGDSDEYHDQLEIACVKS